MSNLPSEPKRRADREGTREVLKSGKIRYKALVKGSWIASSACRNDRQAIADLKRKVDLHLNPPPDEKPPAPTVLEYLEFCLNGPWKEQVAHELMAPTNWELYRGIIATKVVGSDIADIPLDEFEARDYEKWVASLITEQRYKKGQDGERIPFGQPRRPMDNASKRRYATMIVTAFVRAHLVDKIIEVNPIKGHPKPKASKTPKFRVMNQDGLQDAIEICRTRPRESHRTRAELAVRLGFVGLGPAEACGLRYEDFDGQGIDIKRQIQRFDGKKQVRETLKTEQRRDFVPIHDEVLIALLSEKKEGWVFPVESKTQPAVMEPNNLRRMIDDTFRGTDFEGFDPYDFRHSYARELLDGGVDLRTCADLMRHSPEMFIKQYVDTDRERKIATAKKLAILRIRTPNKTNTATA